MSNKRERQRQNREERLQAEAKAATAARRNRLIVRWVIIGVLVLGAALVYSLLSNGDDNQTVAGEASPTSEAIPADTALTASPDCPAEDGSAPRTTAFDARPPICIDDDTIYAADFVTTSGDFTAILDPSLDLASVNNFIVLARYHAYDGTIFHRVIDDFVVQGGDVQNRFGVGDPGYRFTGAFPPEDIPYQVGSLAMANSGNPSSNGSQFFIVTGGAGANLPGQYSLMGQVTAGVDVAVEMQRTTTGTREVGGREASDVPVEDIVLESVTIREASTDEIDEYETTIG